MNLSDKITIPAQVLARQVGDETVILDMETGTYYGLDPVGARMWQLMVEGCTLREVCEVMLNEYDVAKEDLERDVAHLVEALCENHLVGVSVEIERGL